MKTEIRYSTTAPQPDAFRSICPWCRAEIVMPVTVVDRNVSVDIRALQEHQC